MIRKLIKKCPPLLFIVRLFRTGFLTGQDLMLQLPHYVPLAEGPQRFRTRVTLQAARETDLLLAELVGLSRLNPCAAHPIERFCPTESHCLAADHLGELFKVNGSDKSTAHNYHMLYGAILANRQNQSLNVLEIGLGTNNSAFLANMGPGGKPGASLRAFRDHLPNSHVFGADIDQSILFSEERIETFPVDQLDRSSLVQLSRKLGSIKFDLIIDDGLHVPNANLNTLIFGLDMLKSDGIMVIEDISDSSLRIWEIASAILSEKYRTCLVKARGGNLFVVCGPDAAYF